MIKTSLLVISREVFFISMNNSLNGAIDKMKKELFRISV